jgi:SlyX protein
MSEDRFVDIESKLAHQEHLLLELNEVITKQQEKIMRLESLCESIIKRIRSIGEAGHGDPNAEEMPPHY